MTTSRWNFQGNSYAQDQLKYSDLMSMQNNFTSALTNIPEEQNGGVADGRFNLSGDYSSSLTSPVYLMVTGQDGETALFVFKDVSSDSLLNYDNIDISGTETFDLWLTTKEQALTNELDLLHRMHPGKHQSAKQYHPAFDPGTRDSHHELAGFDGPDGTP